MASLPQLALQTLAGGIDNSDKPVILAPSSVIVAEHGEKIVPRRRFQKGRVYKRGDKWVGSFREYDVHPETGKRARRTITFDASVTSERAARTALQPSLDDYNARAKANLKPSAPRGAKTVGALLEEWTDKILPNRKLGGARAAQSHIRASSAHYSEKFNCAR